MTPFYGPASDSAVGYPQKIELLGHHRFFEHFGLLLIIVYFSSCDIIDQHWIIEVVLPDKKTIACVRYHVNIIWLQTVVKPGSVRLIDCNFYRFKPAFLGVTYCHFHFQSFSSSLVNGPEVKGGADKLLLRLIACFFRKLSASISMIIA